MELFSKIGRKYQRATHEQIMTVAREIAANEIIHGPALTSPQKTREFLVLQYATLEHEVFGVVFLSNRHRVVAFEMMFRGTIDGASVHPREVVKAALKHNAAAVIFAHNHPSGVAEASQADELITRRLIQCLALVDIRVLDHVIVAGRATMSFAERGLLG